MGTTDLPASRPIGLSSAQFRPCTLNATRLAEVSNWAEQYRHIWDDRFDRMDDYVRNIQKSENKKDGATND